jgi:hypothetical protein
MKPALTENLDNLNKAIQDVESALLKANLCVATSVPLDPSKNDSPALGYGKLNNVWRLQVIFGNKAMPAALITTSQQMRLQAADRLGDLYAEMIGTHEDRLSRVSGAIHKFETFAKMILERKPNG